MLISVHGFDSVIQDRLTSLCGSQSKNIAEYATKRKETNV